MNFIQTTDVKNGIHYVKEKKKDENRQLSGDAEFIKYVDGFEKAGASIGHAINKAFVPLQSEFSKKLEGEIGQPPNEDDYEDEEEYIRKVALVPGAFKPPHRGPPDPFRIHERGYRPQRAPR